MNNLINFPVQNIRNWNIIESSIKETMKKVNASEKMEKEIISRIKKFYDKFDKQFSFNFEFSPSENLSESTKQNLINSINKSGKQIADQIHEFTSQIFADRILIETELYLLKNNL